MPVCLTTYNSGTDKWIELLKFAEKCALLGYNAAMRSNFVQIRCPKTVRNYHCLLCSNPEGHSSHLLCDASLNTHSFCYNQATKDMLQ